MADLAVRYHVLACPRTVQGQGRKAAAEETHGRNVDDQKIRLREVTAHQLGIIERAMLRNALSDAPHEGHWGITWRGDG